ncbi:MAG: hypothetical protein ACLGSA_04240 [Acidobacteriota bacterium]
MSTQKDLQRLDELLEMAFEPGTRSGAMPGFESRVMARIMEASREVSLWDVLRSVARPILYSGWAAAAVLAVVALTGQDSSSQHLLASVMTDSPVTQWLVL